ncbi:hypothetical protein LTR08_004891 [Meristemomyces frigidus]|nr:hypothetical protein LTR08_004891 [Meristemomyces frigidus]
MAIFAPVYRPSEGQQTFLTRQQKRERKRKRDSEASNDSSESASSPEPDDRRRPVSLHPVRKTDPYHVAGHTREAPLPPPPFPHAAVRLKITSKQPVEEELAALTPPLYATKQAPEDISTSSRRRHIDNLTTVLHTCMLRGDWQRASRAWGLLLRTETAGLGMDVRRHGRWGIGAELLMRGGPASTQAAVQRPAAGSVQPSHSDRVAGVEEPVFTDEGFRLAREYYERLILQYPYKPRIQQHLMTAVAAYPALFNIWIYEVQDRSHRARRRPSADRPFSPSSSEHSANVSSTSGAHGIAADIRKKELAEALPIAQRMDELMLSPPYDSSLPLLQLRGMVGLWLSDLYTVHKRRSSSDDGASNHSPEDSAQARQSRRSAEAEKQKALIMIKKVKDAGGEMPKAVLELLENDWSEMSG